MTMNQIGSLFTDLKKNQDKNTERGELMRKFLTHLNPPRIMKRLPPLNYGRMGKLLQNIPTKDLYYFLKVCEDSKNFSARFWWELDPKKHES